MSLSLYQLNSLSETIVNFSTMLMNLAIAAAAVIAAMSYSRSRER